MEKTAAPLCAQRRLMEPLRRRGGPPGVPAGAGSSSAVSSFPAGGGSPHPCISRLCAGPCVTPKGLSSVRLRLRGSRSGCGQAGQRWTSSHLEPRARGRQREGAAPRRWSSPAPSFGDEAPRPRETQSRARGHTARWTLGLASRLPCAALSRAPWGPRGELARGAVSLVGEADEDIRLS